MVDELAWWVEALAAMTEETRSVGFGVEVEKEGPEHHGKTAVEHIKTVLQLNCTNISTHLYMLVYRDNLHNASIRTQCANY